MNTKQIQKRRTLAGSLPDGAKFECPSVSETMKNLKVLRVNESRVCVEGYFRDSINESWKFKQMENISCHTEVEVVLEFSKDNIETPKPKKDIVVSEPKPKFDPKAIILPKSKKIAKVADVNIIPKSPGQRGRKRMEVVINWPKDKSFTVSDIVQETGISQGLVYLRLQEEIAAGNIILKEKIKTEGQRGRATNYYISK